MGDSNNRVGELCWYAVAIMPSHMPSVWKRGVLRAWSMDYDEHENGPAMYPVAVIEDAETRAVRSIYVERVSFAHERPE